MLVEYGILSTYYISSETRILCSYALEVRKITKLQELTNATTLLCQVENIMIPQVQQKSVRLLENNASFSRQVMWINNKLDATQSSETIRNKRINST